MPSRAANPGARKELLGLTKNELEAEVGFYKGLMHEKYSKLLAKQIKEDQSRADLAEHTNYWIMATLAQIIGKFMANETRHRYSDREFREVCVELSIFARELEQKVWDYCVPPIEEV